MIGAPRAPGRDPAHSLPRRVAAWRRAIRFADLAVVALALVVVALAALRWQADRSTTTVLRAADPTTGPEASAPAAQLARAVALARDGDADGALARYRQVEAEGGATLRRIARFDTANLYLRQAFGWIQAGDRGRAIPLIELAKGVYRQLLTEDPDDWDLRYNLERAIRLLPEEDPDGGEVLEPPQQAERAVTTMRGTSQGLP